MNKPYLTELDKELIIAKIQKNEPVDINKTRCLNTIEEHWARAKGNGLFDLLDGNLILKKKISVSKSVDQLQEEMSSVGRDLKIEFFREVRAMLQKDSYYPEDAAFIENLISDFHLVGNRVFDNYELKIENKKPIKFTKGQKLTKAIKQLCGVFDIDMNLFETFRIQHSQVLNDKTIKGTLCLSIHPLDYLTMSDNAHDWDSCMSWDNEGCYRTGTLECMNCEETLVAYIESDNKKYSLDYGLEWNSKKWRQLVMFNEEIIMTNKGYPFQNNELSQIVLNWVAELAGENYEGENIYYEDYISNDIEGFEYIRVEAGDAMYDDTDNGSCSYVRLARNFSPVITVGVGNARAYCLNCGDEIDTDEDMICNECNGYFYCDICEESCPTDIRVDSPDRGTICKHCHSQNYAMCENCEEVFQRDSGNEITYLESDADLDKYQNWLCEGYYCKSCLDSMPKKEEKPATDN